MLEKIKEVLLERYNKKIVDYNVIKDQIIEIEKTIMEDNSEQVYKESLKNLKKSGLKKNSEDYQNALDQINSVYNKGILSFKDNHEKYTELRRQAGMIDIYGYKRKITRVENAKELSDLKLDEDKASKILSGELEDIM